MRITTGSHLNYYLLISKVNNQEVTPFYIVLTNVTYYRFLRNIATIFIKPGAYCYEKVDAFSPQKPDVLL